MHFNFLCNEIRPYLRFHSNKDSQIFMIKEMLEELGTFELYKSEEFQKILCKKIYEYKWISQNVQNGIPEFYEYVNS
jgi:hypothetical protein